MKTILREEASGVSEVLGTILILGMTVTLFSAVILFVTTIPTPQVQTRSDLSAYMQPIYGPGGLVAGVNITLTHMGGEALQPASTVFYLMDQPANGAPVTDVATLHRFNRNLPVPSGLIDGSDSVWTTGERWLYLNQNFNPSDTITVTVVDTTRSLVIWSGPMNPAAGTRPPVFESVWATGTLTNGAPNPVIANQGFYLYAKVVSPDNDLNPNSVFATLTMWYNTGTNCSVPLPMQDVGNGIFSLGLNFCTSPPYPLIGWSGSLILLNATDTKGHQTQTRFVLNVFTSTGQGGGISNNIPNQVWQYIGFVQIQAGNAWLTNITANYTSSNQFLPFRVSHTWLKAGVVFHFRMANHGNTTIFLDGWNQAFFTNTQSATTAVYYIVAPCSSKLPANGGGVVAYPGSPTAISNFSYSHPGVPTGCSSTVPPAVFDIDPFDQQTGGTPYTVLMASNTAYSLGESAQWSQTGAWYISILVSGMAGPINYTYAQLVQGGANPYGCTGLGASYNPILHLNDPIKACRTSWYAQVIPFIGMVVY